MRQRPTLPHGFPCSTIGSGGLNFRVRDGNGCDPTDIATANLEKSGALRKSNTKGAAKKRHVPAKPRERVAKALDLDLDLGRPAT
jgi:hypothetical protein